MAALLCERCDKTVFGWISIDDKEGDTGLKADPGCVWAAPQRGSTDGGAADDRARVGPPPRINVTPFLNTTTD